MQERVQDDVGVEFRSRIVFCWGYRDDFVHRIVRNVLRGDVVWGHDFCTCTGVTGGT